MKITFKIKSRGSQRLLLFGARFNYILVNYGNNTSISFEDVEVCDEYKNLIGDFPKEAYNKVHCILMDCLKHDLIIDSINGLAPEMPIKETSPTEYEQRPFNAYNEACEVKVNDGFNTIEVELHLKK